MKILFVSNQFGYGAAKMLLFVARGLQNKEHKVYVLVLGDAGKFDYLAEGINVIYTKGQATNPVTKLYKDIKFVYHYASLLKPDILASFLVTPNFITTIVGKLLNIPSVISERVDPFVEYENSSAFSRFQRKITNFATGAVFQTEGAAKFYRECLRERSVVIPNPIEIIEEIQPIDYKNMPKEIISLGRLNNQQKRLDVTLEAFAIFHESHPDYKLRIYGGGKDETYLHRYIHNLGIDDCVILMGISKKSVIDLAKGGIFLITSDYEGISNSLLEAMAVGLPVVSTDHSPGGARLLISDHQNGLLVPIRNKQATAKALCEFADNIDLASICGRNAKEVTMRFHPEKILDSWEKYLKSFK